MKKNYIYPALVLLLVCLIMLCFFIQDDSVKLTYINYGKYEELLNGTNPEIIYVSNNECEGCIQQTPHMQYLSGFYNLNMYTLTLNDLTNEQISKLAFNIDEEATTITAPSVLIVQNGSVIDSLIGYYDTKDISDFLKENRILNGLIHITIDDYLELVYDTEVSLVYVGKESCPSCVEFEPILTETLTKYNVVAYYLNMDKLTNEEKHSYMDSFEELNEGIYTPNLLIVKDGELIDSLVGIISEEEIYAALKTYEIIKEEGE